MRWGGDVDEAMIRAVTSLVRLHPTPSCVICGAQLFSWHPSKVTLMLEHLLERHPRELTHELRRLRGDGGGDDTEG